MVTVPQPTRAEYEAGRPGWSARFKAAFKAEYKDPEPMTYDEYEAIITSCLHDHWPYHEEYSWFGPWAGPYDFEQDPDYWIDQLDDTLTDPGDPPGETWEEHDEGVEQEPEPESDPDTLYLQKVEKDWIKALREFYPDAVAESLAFIRVHAQR